MFGKILFDPHKHSMPEMEVLRNPDDSQEPNENLVEECYEAALKLEKRNKLGLAYKRLEYVMSRGPSPPRIMYLAGMLKEKSGDIPQAYHHYKATQYASDKDSDIEACVKRTWEAMKTVDDKALESLCERWTSIKKNQPLALTDIFNSDVFITKWIQGSAAIEGIHVEEDDIELILNDKPTNDPLSKQLEILGLHHAFKYIRKMQETKGNWKTLKSILQLHSCVMCAKPEIAGKLRDDEVYIGRQGTTKSKYLQLAMAMLESWLGEASRLHPIHRAAAAHYYLVAIHPFEDGNGRTARLLMSWILIDGGFPPVLLGSENEEGYRNALAKCQKEGSPYQFIRYVVGELGRTLDKLEYD